MSIKDFLEILQGTVRGRIIAVNMLASVTTGLLSPAAARLFLQECADAIDAPGRRTADPVQIVEYVSCAFGSGRQYLRQARQPPFDAGTVQMLSTTMRTETFFRFMVSPRYKVGSTGIPVFLPPRPVNTVSGERDYERRLSAITADPDWFDPVATLGRPMPFPSNCWVTTDTFGPDPSSPVATTAATSVRDQLGLVDYGDGTFLVRLSFAALSLIPDKGCEMARPTSCDLGNSRFRVKTPSARADQYASLGWGATVHLGKLADKTSSESTGASERVIRALALSALKQVAVQYLSKVISDRGTTDQDDDEAFARSLEQGNTHTAIRDELMRLL